MSTALVQKITGMLQEYPAHTDWDIEILDIQPRMDGLFVVYRNKGAIQRLARLLKYRSL